MLLLPAAGAYERKLRGMRGRVKATFVVTIGRLTNSSSRGWRLLADPVVGSAVRVGSQIWLPREMSVPLRRRLSRDHLRLRCDNLERTQDAAGNVHEVSGHDDEALLVNCEDDLPEKQKDLLFRVPLVAAIRLMRARGRAWCRSCSAS